ncbi:MAG: DUF3656 domain-containing U32 family peptidase [Planctomycetota bacterium]
MRDDTNQMEILAPAGGPECLPAAVAGGAGAVYFGLRHFNARGRAANFRMAELPAQLGYLHRHGLKAYLVLNTLVHDDEFPKALRLAAAARAAAVDAIIVQDLGLWRLLRQELPDLPLHASTQMTVHSPEQIQVLAELGAERVILARELDLEEIAACTGAARELGVETEVFVHGALCYAWSGQCLMSNFAGCRSANRGTCAQNCRFQYDDDKGAVDTVISMKDFAAVARVPELLRAGVASLKIEGRLKGPDYVYTVSRVYAAALAAAQRGEAFDLQAARQRLGGVFSRGHTDAPLTGERGPAARLHRFAPTEDRSVDAWLLRGSRAKGELLLRSQRQPSPGVGYQFSSGAFSDGFLVTAVQPGPESGTWRCRVRIGKRGPGLEGPLACFRNADQRQQAAARQAMAAVQPRAGDAVGVPLAVELRLVVAEPAVLVLRTRDGRQVRVGGDVVLAATGAGLDEARLRSTIGALGGTDFVLDALRLDMPAPAFLPASALKRLRREALAALQAQPIPEPSWQPPAAQPVAPRRTALWLAVASPEAAKAVLAAGADGIVLDDPSLDLWRGPVDLSAYAAVPPQQRLLRLPVTAPIPDGLTSLDWGLCTGQQGGLRLARAAGVPAVADHSANLVNSQTLQTLGEQGAAAAVISLECSAREIARLCSRCQAAELPALWCVVHGRVMSMLSRQQHALAPGERRRIQASAAEGGLPYIMQGHVGGDTVIQEARELCAPEHAAATAGIVDAWLLECAHLDAATCADVTRQYRALADGDQAAAARIQQLTLAYTGDGLFPGHLAIGSRALDEVRA